MTNSVLDFLNSVSGICSGLTGKAGREAVLNSYLSQQQQTTGLFGRSMLERLNEQRQTEVEVELRRTFFSTDIMLHGGRVDEKPAGILDRLRTEFEIWTRGILGFT